MKEKLDYFINRLRELPDCRKDEFYRYADYFELKCLINKDGEYSIADFIDDAKPRTEDLGEGDIEDNEETKELPKAQKNDKWETRARDSIRVIETRVSLFGDSYPFNLSANKRAIQLRDDITNKKLYIFLLLASNLRYTSKFKTELTGSFEKACEEVFKKVLPSANVKLFGSSNSEEPESEWKSSKLWDKLKWMEEYLSERLRIEEDDISKYDKGDRGIDLIGKIDLGDKLGYFPIFFGQCACSPKDWVTKQDSMKFASWYELISLGTDPNYFMFIPHSFRDSKGEWHDRTKIRRTVIFDRLRIIKNFDNPEVFNNLSSTKVIDEIVKVKESVY